ncbi:glycolate oxidase subunit GlcE [Pseudomonas asuensis]|uniref:Glycolate oxidase subunit GlcE n=2 Tax=Pseudomonas asuensis TaxID=1825787 RepID=A0ABQ2H067_9PSED|nr:glycolate oxidase subunit GlcE [Pseudomonas asuensis]
MDAMTASHDAAQALQDEVQQAIAQRQPLRIRGSDSKRHLGRPVEGIEIDARLHRGIVTYDPTELVVTVRTGTPLNELEAALEANGQMLPCEPPHFGPNATVGGMMATGLSGPRRPWVGSVRDFVLGTRIITGEGKHLRFGGEVMKNVAGYDLSRLLAGSFGCLGLITEVSFKVLPKPRTSASLQLELDPSRALIKLAEWERQAIPLAGACHDGRALYIRLEGGEGSVAAARDRIGGDALPATFWTNLREHRLEFFADPRPLWRLSLPNHTPVLDLPGTVLMDWAGAQRWLKSDMDAAALRHRIEQLGGHATCFTPDNEREPFHPLAPALLKYQRQLKQQMDPHGLFNPGRLYAEL